MERLGKYKIESKIGQGAMGAVYKAWHPGFNDYVALKTIQNSPIGGRDLLDRFKFEGQALAKLKHQNIVQIYDADQAEGIHFIVMEYMNGPGLDHLISSRADVPLAKKVSYIVPICEALGYAHKRRLFHRDIKPANIMLQHDGEEEIVKVVDFGIVRLLDFSQTSTNLFIGAPAYMAPELLTAEDKANEKTDIWALGVTFYELIAYRRPFEGATLEELKRKIVNDPPGSLSRLSTECPDDLAAVVGKMLAKDPAARYQVVEDLMFELEPIAKRLRADAATTLVRRATDCYEIGDFEAAKISLKEARKYDATNTYVRELMLKIQDELHRKELIPRLQGHLKRGREFLQSGLFREARIEAEAALGLDTRFEPAQRLLQEIEQGVVTAQVVEQKIRLTKQRLSEGLLTQAEALLTEAEGLDDANPQLPDLKRQVNEERQRRERRKRLNQKLNEARALLSGLDYDQCLAAIAEGLKEFPGEPELRKLQEAARAELAELEKQRAKQREIGESRALIAREDYEGALVKIEQLSRVYPQDTVIKSLQALALEGSQQQKKRRRLEAGMAELRELLMVGDYRAVVARGEDLLREYPKEQEVRDLLNYAAAEVAQEESRQKQQAVENNIWELLKVGDFSAAESEASRAVEEHPGNVNFRALLAEAIRLKKRNEEQEELRREAERRSVDRLKRESEERLIAEVRTLNEKGDISAATLLLDDITSQGILSAQDERVRLLRLDIEEKKHILELRAQQERRRKENEVRCIAAIKDLLARGDLRAAMHLLIQSVQDKSLSPGEEQVKQLQSEIEEKRKHAELQRQEEERRRAEQDSRIEAAIALIDQEDWDQAAQALQDINREKLVPTMVARIEHLEHEIQEKRKFREFCQQAEQRRREDQDRRLEEITVLLRKNDCRGAARILRDAIAEGLLAPHEDRVKKLQADIDQETRSAELKRQEEQKKRQSEEQRKRELEEQRYREVQTLMDEGDFGGATRLFEKATADGIFPLASDRAKRLEAAIKEARRQEAIRSHDKQKRKGGQLLQDGEEVAQPPSSPPSVSDLASAGPLNQSSQEENARGPATAMEPGGSGNVYTPAAASAAPAPQAEGLSVVEKHLAALIGPVAMFLVKKARMNSSQPEEQLKLLASSLHDESDRQVFLAREDEMLACLAALPSPKTLSPVDTAQLTSVAPRPAELTPEAVHHASELLAQYLGPISRVLTERAAKRAENLQAMFQMLSEHLKDRKERARFLSEAGFPEE